MEADETAVAWKDQGSSSHCRFVFLKLPLKFSGTNSVHFHPVGSGKLKLFFAPQVGYVVFVSHFAFLSLWYLYGIHLFGMIKS